MMHVTHNNMTRNKLISVEQNGQNNGGKSFLQKCVGSKRRTKQRHQVTIKTERGFHRAGVDPRRELKPPQFYSQPAVTHAFIH